MCQLTQTHFNETGVVLFNGQHNEYRYVLLLGMVKFQDTENFPVCLIWMMSDD